jgi:acyl-CoA reductase-like NAD-dependent aldehyde dehydrogenase
MTERLGVSKTYKLFIDGKFPRSESGRTLAVEHDGAIFAHVCRGSRKDLRDAASAARKALPGWSGATAYNRGQILYRMAEMIEGKRGEFVEALSVGGGGGRGKKRPASRPALSPEAEVAAAIDRLVGFAGWSDKFQQVLGSHNPVAGPFYNFTVPQAVGVVGVLGPDRPGLLGLVSLVAPALVAGNTVVSLGGESPGAQVATAVLGEVLATSDVPAGVVNLLTGLREELAPVFAGHRDIDAIHAGGVGEAAAGVLRAGAAENVKRVTVREDVDWLDAPACESAWWIEPLIEFKTVWHSSAV